MRWFPATLAAASLAWAQGGEDVDGTCAAGSSCAQESGLADGLRMPRVIIGCWQLLERHSSKDKAVETLTAYANAGFVTFDTADIYGPSESILGQFRSRWAAANPTAAPLKFFTKYVTDDASPRNADRINRQSLSNLGVTSADLVQFHWWSLAPDGSQKEFVRAGQQLTRLKSEGKIRHLAGCNMDTVNLKVLVDSGMHVEANQVQYSILDRRPEVKLLQYCSEKGIKLTVFGVVAGGLLSDSFVGLSKQQAQGRLDSVSRRMYWTSLQRWSSDWELFQRLLTTLQAVGKEKQPPLTLAAVACEWVLYQLEAKGAGGALILGMRDDRHLVEHSALLAGEARLDEQDMKRIDAVLQLGNLPTGDIWHQERGWA